MQILKSIVDIIAVLVYIGLLGSMIWMSISLFKYFQVKQKSLENDIEHKQLEEQNKNKTVEYSNRALELIRSIIGQIAVIKFRTFKDTHDLRKVTKANIESLARDVANMAKDSLNTKNIFLDDTFFTRDFYEKYIIETSIILTKQMLDKAIEELDEEY